MGKSCIINVPSGFSIVLSQRLDPVYLDDIPPGEGKKELRALTSAETSLHLGGTCRYAGGCSSSDAGLRDVTIQPVAATSSFELSVLIFLETREYSFRLMKGV